MSQSTDGGTGAADPALVRVEIESIRKNAEYPHRVVCLKDPRAERYLYVVVGVPEADAIALKLNGVQVPRPMTHDLLLSGFTALGANVHSVVVNDHRGDTFYAQVYLDVETRRAVLDARPSDALALAVRANVPIFVAESVLSACATTGQPGAL